VSAEAVERATVALAGTVTGDDSTRYAGAAVLVDLIVDQLLPGVATANSLRALPVGTKVMDPTDGTIWERQENEPRYGVHDQWVSLTRSSGIWINADELIGAHSVVRIIWQPEQQESGS
jgi:hypothetical protein